MSAPLSVDCMTGNALPEGRPAFNGKLSGTMWQCMSMIMAFPPVPVSQGTYGRTDGQGVGAFPWVMTAEGYLQTIGPLAKQGDK